VIVDEFCCRDGIRSPLKLFGESIRKADEKTWQQHGHFAQGLKNKCNRVLLSGISDNQPDARMRLGYLVSPLP